MFSAVVPAFAAFPGQKYEYDYSPSGPYGEYTYSLIGADYGGSKYNYGYFHSLRYKGSAQFSGHLWFWWTIDDEEIEWYNTGTEEYQEGALDATYLSVETLSWFYVSGVPQWSRRAFADI